MYQLLRTALIALALCSLGTCLSAQADPAALLANAATAMKAPTFGTMLRVCIGLEKTNGWDTPLGKGVLAQVATLTPDQQRWFDGARLLARDDARGLTRLFAEGTPPGDPTTFVSDTRILGQYGCALTATAATVLANCGKNPNAMIDISDPVRADAALRAWAKIPPEGMAGMEAAARPLLDICPGRLRDFMKRGPSLALQAGVPDERAGLARAYGSVCHLDGVGPLDGLVTAGIDVRKPEIANSLIEGWAQARPGSSWFALRAAALLRERKEEARARGVLKFVTDRAVEPDVRDARVALFVAVLAAGSAEVDVAAAAGSPDLLLAGDALTAQGKLTDAAQRYAAVLADARRPLTDRLHAWAGLLDADPVAAIKAGEALVAEVAKLDPGARAPLLRWMGWQTWRAVAGDVPEVAIRKSTLHPSTLPVPYPRYRIAVAAYTRAAVADVPNGYAGLAGLMERLLAADADTLLRPDPERERVSLRFGAVMLYLLADQPDKAVQALTQESIETIPAPWYGWRDVAMGLPLTNGADKKLKVLNHPTADEFGPLMQAVMDTITPDSPLTRARDRFCLAAAPIVAHRVLVPSWTPNMPGLAVKPIDKYEGTVLLVGACVSACETDPERPDMAAFEPLAAVIQVHSASKKIEDAYHCAIIACPMLVAKSAPVRERLYEIATIYCEKSAQNPYCSSVLAQSVCSRWERSTDPVLKDYAARLKAKYPRG